MNRDILVLSIMFIVLICVHLSEEQSKIAKAFDDLQIEFVKLGLIINDLLKELTGMDLTVIRKFNLSFSFQIKMNFLQQWLELLPGKGENILKIQELFFTLLNQLGATLGGGGGE
ncbi:hypothetical protein PVAND_003391 [Polypedilum vanderplanki]|uniref:Secreted protein n=1 Tax=Polypedilum vanderplanki TaxID=319348 RepID=A0A9J6BUY8_POLVA|nr:hypothetical protein PVAND_003391 [Polypedilum vanderplanki]